MKSMESKRNQDNTDPKVVKNLSGEGEIITFRFRGADPDGRPLHTLRAEHLADVLEGLHELAEDLEEAGITHGEQSLDTELYVKPAREGSFVLEMIRTAAENPDATAAAIAQAVPNKVEWGIPTVGGVIWWVTKGMRAEPKDVTPLEDGRVKINWQDDTVDIVPEKAWTELQKKKKRRKKQLRKIMRPMEDPRVEKLEVRDRPMEEKEQEPPLYTLDKADYARTAPVEEEETSTETFKSDGRIIALDFTNSRKWRVETPFGDRMVNITDETFLREVEEGMGVKKDDLFRMTIVVDTVKSGDRSKNTFTVVHIERIEDGEGDEYTS